MTNKPRKSSKGDRQERILLALVEQPTMEKEAAALSMSTVTLWRWMWRWRHSFSASRSSPLEADTVSIRFIWTARPAGT